jgi:hypothetical protein
MGELSTPSKSDIERGMKIPDMQSHINRLKASWRCPSPSDEVMEQWVRHRIVKILGMDLLQKRTLKELLDSYDNSVGISIDSSKEVDSFERACDMMIRSRELFYESRHLDQQLRGYCKEQGISRSSVGDEVNKRRIQTTFDQQLEEYCTEVSALKSKNKKSDPKI